MFTETSVQDTIWHRYSQKQSLMVVPCSNVFGWEADIVIVTKALIAHEFEIKLSKVDFRNDKKKEKFEHIERWRKGEKKYVKTYLEEGGRTWRWEHKGLQPPNYFWYVCPQDLIKPEEVPTYAGLAYVDKFCFWVQKKPTRLHKDKLTEKELLQLCRAMNFRYWNYRISANKE